MVKRSEWDSLHRGDINRLTVEIHRRAWKARPEVRHIRMGGQDAVVKDYGREADIFKHLLGIFLVAREAAALRRAEGLPHIARVLGRPRLWIIVIEYLPGKPVTEVEPGALDVTYFDELARLVDNLHIRGVAHGDLEKLDNILVMDDGSPAVVDFAAAIMPGLTPLAALALPHVCANDYRAIAKLKERVAPELLSEKERRRLHYRTPAELWFRRIRTYIRDRVKRMAAGATERGASPGN